MPSPTDNRALEALLAEEAWLRRLARGLVGATDGDDLAQDVVVAALQDRPNATGPGLRSWLQTTARRMATRGGERGRNRKRVEELAATPETTEHSSQAQLELRRRLTQAIHELAPQYSTVLVLRYFDDLPPREIAKRLDVPVTTAQKRLSRGLALLREQLDGDFGERSSWMASVGALGFGSRWLEPTTLPLTATAAAGIATTTGLIAMKPIVTGAFALLIIVFGLTRAFGTPWDTRDPQAVAHVEEPVRRDVEMASSPVVANLEAAAVEHRTPVVLSEPAGPAAVPALELAARLRIVDLTGAPLAEARAAWLDREGEMQVLEVEADGTCALPDDSVEQLFYAGATGLATAVVRLENASNDLVLTLQPLVDLQGTVLVDGGPPLDPLVVFCEPDCKFLGLSDDPDVWPAEFSVLSAIGLTEGPLETLTTPGGNFVVTGVHPASSGVLSLPNSFRNPTYDANSSVVYQLPDPHILIEATRAPYLSGRVAWAGDESPFEGWLWAGQLDSDGDSGRHDGLRVLDSGRFEVGLSYKNAEQPELGLTCSSVALEFTSNTGAALPNEFLFDVTADNVPLDVGTLLLEPALLVHLLVTDLEDRPLDRVLVTGTIANTHTDANGHATLEAVDDDRVRLALPGFARKTLPASELSRDPDQRTLVRLDPGVALSITVPRTKQADGEPFITWVSTELTDGLFHPIHPEDEGLFLQQLFLGPGSRTMQIGWDHELKQRQIMFRAGPEPVVLAALTPGYEFEVRLLDRFCRELVRERVRLPLEPGIAELRLVPESTASLTLHIVGDLGQPIQGAQIDYSVPQLCHYSKQIEGDQVTFAPLAEGELTLRVLAPGFETQVVQLMIEGKAQETTVSLSPTREK